MHTSIPSSVIYVVKPEFITELRDELQDNSVIIEDLVFSDKPPKPVCFAKDVWFDPIICSFQSIKDAVNLLRQHGKYWYLHPLSHIRRSKLIEAQLIKIPPMTRSFPLEKPIPEIGAFSLIDANTLVFSKKRLKAWPDGNCFFVEDKVNPPSRAYLKLWEAMTLLNRHPEPDEVAMDLGASPGGWTYVVQSCGAAVTAIDKAELHPLLMRSPQVTFLKQSAFALEPQKLESQYDWVLSDIACYPSRAYALILKWIESKKAKQLIFTIKLQGKTELEFIKKLQQIPNACIMNLHYNKHEATFFYPAPSNCNDLSCS